MKKAKKTQQLRSTSAARKVRRNGVGSRPAPIAERTSAGPEDRDDWVQMSFRAPPDVAQFMAELKAKRKVTLQTLMLGLLKDIGAPIGKADLADNRGGRKPSRPSAAANHAAKPSRPAKKDSGIDVLKLLRDPRLLKAIAQQSNGRVASPLSGVQIFVTFVDGKVR